MVDSGARVAVLDCFLVVEGGFVLVAVAEVIVSVGTKVGAILSCSDILALT